MDYNSYSFECNHILNETCSLSKAFMMGDFPSLQSFSCPPKIAIHWKSRQLVSLPHAAAAFLVMFPLCHKGIIELPVNSKQIRLSYVC